MAQVGLKAQGHESFGNKVGTKSVADGFGHTPGAKKRRIRRALETKIRQQGRKACQEV